MILEQHADGDVVVIGWNDGDNRVNLDSLAAWHEALDELSDRDGPLSLVITGSGKFFSNGLDLDRLGANTHEWPDTISGLNRLFGRLMVLPMYTVAALNGHTFAAGAMLSLCTDERVMRSDRGYWCLPEADLGLPLSDEMFEVINARLPIDTARRAILTGKRFDAESARSARIVEAVAPEDQVLEMAVAMASAMADTSRETLRTHKEQFNGELARRLGWDNAGLTDR